jgi:hypothetical protein
MSTATHRLWDEYQHLTAEERREFVELLREDPSCPYEVLEPIPIRPAGYFADLYVPEDIALENRLAKSNIIERPQDLE